MSEVQSVVESANPKLVNGIGENANPITVQELLTTLHRLASLLGKTFGVEEQVPDVMNIQKASKWLGCSEPTLRKEAKHGRIPHFKIGNELRFHRDTVLKFKLQRFLKK